MKNGRIVCYGTYDLGLIVDRKGYDWLSSTVNGGSLIEQFNLNKLKLIKN
jgi:spore germination protein YaaH